MWIADGRDTTADASMYGYIELAWRAYFGCTGPCVATGLSLFPSRVATYYPCDGPYSLELRVSDVSLLGAFEACIGFDDALAGFDEATLDTFLTSTGRDAYPLEPTPCAPACNATGTRYGAWSMGAASGPSGTGTLARLAFSRTTDGAGTDSLCLEACELVDTQSPPGLIEVATAMGTAVTHRPYCYGDFNDDGDVSVVDIMQVSSRWGCGLGDACYSDSFDVNLIEPGNYCASSGDDSIDIVDVQTVAGRWAMGCPTGSVPPPMSASTNQGVPVLSIWPESLVVCCNPGDRASFDIILEDAYDLGAFQAALIYDPSVIHIEEIQLGDLLAGTGRAVYPLGPKVDNTSGDARFGAWSLGEDEGAAGGGTLATVTVSIKTCEAATAVTLSGVKLTDSAGWPATLGETSGAVVQTHCGGAGLADPETPLPTAYALYPARPNPAGASTIIGFAIPASAGSVPVEVVIYSVEGRVVKRLESASYPPGYHHIEWDGRDAKGAQVSPGVYFCNLKSPDYTRTRRISIIR